MGKKLQLQQCWQKDQFVHHLGEVLYQEDHHHDGGTLHRDIETGGVLQEDAAHPEGNQDHDLHVVGDIAGLAPAHLVDFHIWNVLFHVALYWTNSQFYIFV